MKRPHILFIVSDQQHPEALGCRGYPVRTPNLDGLAAAGLTAARCYSPCPLCTPARASLLTGQYPSRHGAWSIGVDTPPNAFSFPAWLAAEAGYRTALLGKAHLRSCQREDSFEALPQARDWDLLRRWNGPYYGYETARISVGHAHEHHAHGLHYGLFLKDHGVEPTSSYFQQPGEGPPNNDVGVWDLPEELHSSTWVADETCRFLEEHHHHHPDRPFYACVNFPDPHVPFRVPAPWDTLHDDVALPTPLRIEHEEADKARFYRACVNGDVKAQGWTQGVGLPSMRATQRDSIAWTLEEAACWRIYFGMISLLDKHVGRILDCLESLGMRDDTLIVFTSDHGDLMGHHWLYYKGGSHYYGGAGVPLLASWPGHIEPGSTTDALHSLVDLPVTFNAAAGLEPALPMQGTSQLDVWTSRAEAVRRGVWIDHRVEAGVAVDSWITEAYRLSHYSYLDNGTSESELFSFADDPHEFRNVAVAEPARVATLSAELNAYRHQVQRDLRPRLTFA